MRKKFSYRQMGIMKEALRKAIFVMGSQKELAKHLGVSHQAVSAWYTKGFCPEHRAQEISRLTGVPVKKLISDRKGS